MIQHKTLNAQEYDSMWPTTYIVSALKIILSFVLVLPHFFKIDFKMRNVILYKKLYLFFM